LLTWRCSFPLSACQTVAIDVDVPSPPTPADIEPAPSVDGGNDDLQKDSIGGNNAKSTYFS